MLNSPNTFSLTRYSIEPTRQSPPIPVCIPHVWFRVHPDSSRVVWVWLCRLRNQWHLVDPALVAQYRISNLWQARLYEGVDDQGKTLVIPVTRSGENYESYEQSLEVCLKRARQQWMTIETDKTTRSHRGVPATQRRLEPVWAQPSFDGVIEQAFAGRIIDSHEAASRYFMLKDAPVIEEDWPD